MSFDQFMSVVIVAMFFGPLSFVVAYGLCQFHLALHYRRGHRILLDESQSQHSVPQPVTTPDTECPSVTVQLPVYNELGVVERLIRAVASFDYPRDRLQIQVLDDSTDETVQIISSLIERLRSAEPNLDIEHIRRTNRVGYKAGALDFGLDTATGEFIAIFDADFVPQPTYLKQVMPHFQEDDVAVVQARWHHLNANDSLLTRIQAFMLDAHFTCEQFGRSAGGYFINFNGTAGVWRRAAIDDAGGWEHDTLTEDIDLSYRAQLKGWRLKYLEDVEAPSELPVTMDAVRSQQFRWTKGIAEVGRKCLMTVWRSPIGLQQKVHASAHLLLSINYISAFVASIMSIPLLLWMQSHPEINVTVAILSAAVILSMLAFAFFFWTSRMRFEHAPGTHRLRTFIWLYPCFLSYYLAMSLHNSFAAIEGFWGIRSPFVRTPKLRLNNDGDQINEGQQYLTARVPRLFWVEAFLCIAFVWAAAYGVAVGDWRLVLYHLQLSFGFGLVCYFTIGSARQITAMQKASAVTDRSEADESETGPSDIPTDTTTYDELRETAAEVSALPVVTSATKSRS